MPPRIVKSYDARRDLLEHFISIGRHNVTAAERFLNVTERAFELLAQMPELGTLVGIRNPALSELRYLTLRRRFRRFVIYYRPLPDGIEVVRVLHSSQDAERLFESQ